jgi:hypothetical protein
VLFGDSAYPWSAFLFRSFKGEMSAAEEEFNRVHKTGRVTVENNFANIITRFAFVDFKKNQWLFLRPIGTYYFAAVFFHNLHSCMHPNQTSIKFGCLPLSVEEYLDMLP